MIEKRFNELYNRASQAYCPVYSDFLNLDEQNILALTALPCVLYGGYDTAERVVAAFGDNAEPDGFPITCIQIKPSNPKFADKLTHRDFLGGLMNLGIKRELLGDIVSVRGYGRFELSSQVRKTKKDNIAVEVKIF